MSTEQLVALLGALTALIVAIGAVLQQLVMLRRTLNGRLSDLVETTRAAALKEGELRGRDHVLELLDVNEPENIRSGVTD